MHPGKPLPTISNGTTKSKLEGQLHGAQSTAALTEDNAKTHQDHTGTFIGSLKGLSFPVLTDTG